MPDTNTVFSLLASFTLGGLGSAYASHYFTNKRWYKEYRLKKLEELYTNLKQHIGEYHLVIDRKWDCMEHGQRIGELKEPNDLSSVAYSNAVMVVNIYFGSLRGRLNEVEIVKDDYWRSTEAWREGYEDYEGQYQEELSKISKLLRQREDIMVNGIFDVAEGVRRGWNLRRWAHKVLEEEESC